VQKFRAMALVCAGNFDIFTTLKPILEIRAISKKYQIEGNKKPYLSLRENLFSFLKPANKKEEFWALRDISFDVMPGDTLGIIGKNGAGKSTLLKILSKITPPTKGGIISRGRIASLLEVGTGFHPELSGRENIFMNGSILGMKKAEIQKHFDEIVDFSGVAKFLDTPLKHYSSGMQLRLAFAVAAHLEPEIMVIDEVLAVGDAEFQKKCLNKMQDVSSSGRTILFVSHQLSSVDALCRKAIVLHEGRLVAQGSTKEAIAAYTSLQTKGNKTTVSNQYENLVSDLEIFSGHENPKEINPHDKVTIRGKLSLTSEISNPTIGIVVRNMFNIPVLGINNKTYGVGLKNLKKENFEIVLNSLPLTPGYYDIDLFIGDGLNDLYTFESILEIEVSDKNIFSNGRNPDPRLNSFILSNVEWKIGSN
jgi:lipopolysaccharide transport system ATP-binding protein